MKCTACVLFVAAIVLGSPLGAETVGTLTLDSLSYVSFQDEETLPLASGTIRFHFGDPLSTGSIPFTIEPGDVAIPEIPLPSGGTLTYALASSTSGVMIATSTGRKVSFTADIAATFRENDHEGTLRYAVPFTTETASASSQSGDESVEATGIRLVEGAAYVRLVGATTNGADAVPKPGTAVYTVLSGQFDQLP